MTAEHSMKRLERRHSSRTRIRGIGLAIALLVPLAACSKLLPKRKVDVNKGTPQAAVASLMKLYANGEEARASEVIDPAAARIETRMSTCPMTRESTSYGMMTVPHCCKSKTTRSDFADTKLHAYLHDGNLKPTECSITNTWEYTAPPPGSFYTP